jgi:hypothetical protein
MPLATLQSHHKIDAVIAAAYFIFAAVATAELSAAKVLFQRIQPGSPPT